MNVAEIRGIPRGGEMVQTGIWKLPVGRRVAVRGVNVAGDEEADRSVHGGHDKALYAYAREDTDWWERELGGELPHGVFGGNLTLRGVEEGEPAAGDAVQIAERPGHGLTIAGFAHAFLEDRESLSRLLEVPAVSKTWRNWARERAA